MDDGIEEGNHGFGGVDGAASMDRVKFWMRAGLELKRESSILAALTSASGNV